MENQEELIRQIALMEEQLNQSRTKLNKLLESDGELLKATEEPTEEINHTTNEELLQGLHYKFEMNRLKRDTYRTYMFFFSFPVVLLFLLACTYGIYHNPTDKALIGLGTAALSLLATLLGVSLFKKNK